MRIKLSKRGWNNVLIFASMFMIVLFNYSHQLINKPSASGERQPLLPIESILQSIDYSGIKFERIGSNWRISSQLSTDSIDDVNQYIATWQQQDFEVMTDTPLMLATSRSLPVVIWALGQQQGWIYEFIVDDVERTLYVKDHARNLWYLLDYRFLPQLVPAPLLKQ